MTRAKNSFLSSTTNEFSMPTIGKTGRGFTKDVTNCGQKEVEETFIDLTSFAVPLVGSRMRVQPWRLGKGLKVTGPPVTL